MHLNLYRSNSFTVTKCLTSEHTIFSNNTKIVSSRLINPFKQLFYEGLTISVVVETFPRPFRDLSTCLNFEMVRYIKIPTTVAIESNDLNIEN